MTLLVYRNDGRLVPRKAALPMQGSLLARRRPRSRRCPVVGYGLCILMMFALVAKGIVGAVVTLRCSCPVRMPASWTGVKAFTKVLLETRQFSSDASA